VPTTYAVTDLGTLAHGTGSSGKDLNEAGQVVGCADVYEWIHAFLWNNGTMIDLGTLGGSNSYALGINDLGQVVGYADLPGDAAHDAFLITPQGGEWFRDSDLDGRNDLMIDLGTLPGTNWSSAADINNAGQVVGNSGDNFFLWEAGNGMVDLGGGWATGINEAGQVVGNSGWISFLWDAAHGMTDLGAGPDYTAINAADINDVGQVVGYRWNDSSASNRAFLWTPDSPNGLTGSFIDLPVPPDTVDSSAYAINNAGQVVGYSSLFHGEYYDSYAALWDAEGGMVYLEDHLLPGPHAAFLPNAGPINDHGVILTGGMYNGHFHAYLLTPDSPGSPWIQIADAPAVTEGNTGTVAATFTVTLSVASTQTVTVAYATADGTATAGSDYQAASGTLTIPAGQTSGAITVLVNGDRLAEPNETFVVNLSNPNYGVIFNSQGVGTIVDDEPRIGIYYAPEVTEGNTGTVNANFTVWLSPAYDAPVTVNFATANGTATAGSDYQAATGTLTFAPGETSKTVTVLVNGDRLGERNETFFVNLSSATNATIAYGQGVGTIVDDEPRIRISDVSKLEGQTGQSTLFTFTVTLSAAYDQPVTVSFGTANGTAKRNDNDYVAKSGTLTFAPGETTKTITIEVKGDSKKEADETFYLDLFGNSSNSLFTKNRGLGTILNDD
jgi:probable HAF family extracellular repeat protein